MEKIIALIFIALSFFGQIFDFIQTGEGLIINLLALIYINIVND